MQHSKMILIKEKSTYRAGHLAFVKTRTISQLKTGVKGYLLQRECFVLGLALIELFRVTGCHHKHLHR